MKKNQPAIMLVTCMILSSGFNYSFAKNIQAEKTLSCSSKSDCKKKCEQLGNIWKPDSTGVTYGTCTKKQGFSSNKLKAISKSNIALTSQISSQKNRVKPKKPLKSALSKPQKNVFIKPVLPSVTKSTTLKPAVEKSITGIKKSPKIKNIRTRIVKRPTAQVKNTANGSGMRNNFSHIIKKENLPKIPMVKRSAGFASLAVPAKVGKTSSAHGFVPQQPVSHEFVPTGFVPTGFVPANPVPKNLPNHNKPNHNKTNHLVQSVVALNAKKPAVLNGAGGGSNFVANADEDNASKAVTLTISGDSVVVTANIVIDDNQDVLFLDWGDGNFERVNLSAPVLQQLNLSNQDRNNFKFQHEYKKPFVSRYLISTSVTNPLGRKVWDHASFDINPRYQFTLYSIILAIPAGLDSFIEDHAEIEAHVKATQGNQSVFDHTRKESVSNDKSSSLRINGFTREISWSDDPVKIKVDVIESDGVGDEGSLLNDIWDVVSAPGRAVQWLAGFRGVKFDGSNCAGGALCTPGLAVHPQNDYIVTSSVKTDSYDIGTREGTVEVKYSYQLKLIVPLDAPSSELLALP